MKILMSVDMEGITGITDWASVMRKEADYAEGRERMAGDVNAAIEAAVEVGVDEIVVNDAHDRSTNLVISKLNPAARVITGFTKPLGMMQGVEGADAALFIGYHARMGAAPAVLNHTFIGGAFSRVQLNGIEVGEAEMNAALAGHFGVPVVFISGDQTACDLARAFVGPALRTAVVKHAVGRNAAECMHPDVTARRIREAVKEALESLSEARPLRLEPPYELAIEFLGTEMAESATVFAGAEPVDGRTIRCRCDTILDAYKTMMTLGILGVFPVLLRHI